MTGRQIGLLCISFLAVVLVLPHDWPVSRYATSVWAIETETGYCSATLVGANGMYLTASHCVDPGETPKTRSNGAVMKEVLRDAKADLLVLQAPPLGVPLLVAARVPRAGEEVLQLGYGLQSKIITALAGRWIGMVEDGVTVIDGGTIIGMSGGPVVNRQGQIVGLVHAAIIAPNTMYQVTQVTALGPIQAAVKQFAR